MTITAIAGDSSAGKGAVNRIGLEDAMRLQKLAQRPDDVKWNPEPSQFV
jgi:hypothetical protein